MPRDNFLQKTISILRNRVANRCSNPDCRVPTTAAASDTDKTNNIGIAAHICAASPGGPRYSEKMTPEERKSINNGIWLCSNCSIEIDRDEKKFTVSVLNEWKQQAEQLAKKELGNRLPSKEDTINTVAATLTGLPTKFIPTAISNVHEASSQTLEKLDPRFAIKSSHSDNFTKFTVLAKKDVEVQMQIPSDNKGQFIDRHNRLIEDGEDLEIDANSIKFEGSDLLKEISQIMGKGKIIISSKKIKSVQKLRLVNPENALVETFEDIYGEISPGSKTFTFKGSACDDIFTISYKKDYLKNNAQISFNLDFFRWENKFIDYLPYHAPLLSFFEKLANGWELFTSMHIDGNKVMESLGLFAEQSEFINRILSILYYVEYSKIIAQYLGKRIKFTNRFSCTPEIFNNMRITADIIEGKGIYFEKDLPTIRASLIVEKDAENIKILRKTKEPASFQMTAPKKDTLICFGEKLELPYRNYRLRNVSPDLSNVPENCKEGDEVDIGWIPCEGFECIIEFEVKGSASTFDP